MAYSSDDGAAPRYIPAQNTDEKLVQRRVADMVKAVSATGRARFTAFLTDREQALCTAQLNQLSWRDFRYFGGYEDAERKMLCVFEDERQANDFPIEALIVHTGTHTLSHRDYLGALMALGLERACSGDILVNSGQALVYLQSEMAPLVREELREIGRHPASVTDAGEGAMQTDSGGAEVHSASVSSPRLDAVLAAMLHESRQRAADLVRKGGVQVNHMETGRPDMRVCAGDVFSIRGTGKFRLEKMGGLSRKNRTFIEYRKY